MAKIAACSSHYISFPLKLQLQLDTTTLPHSLPTRKSAEIKVRYYKKHPQQLSGRENLSTPLPNEYEYFVGQIQFLEILGNIFMFPNFFRQALAT